MQVPDQTAYCPPAAAIPSRIPQSDMEHRPQTKRQEALRRQTYQTDTLALAAHTPAAERAGESARSADRPGPRTERRRKRAAPGREDKEKTNG
eukprot:11159073-Lingulodinium_polyedra.AAC.1